MRVVICPDSFKGSLSADAAARAMARGVRWARPGARIVRLPVADGGEGTLAALAAAGGRRVACRVTGPLGGRVTATLLLLPRRTAVVEMAQAAGLLLVPRARRDPLAASTYGVGEMIAAAAARGARRIIVTLGGSATVDGGAGMAQALGARLLDAAGHPIPRGGAGLHRLARIDASPLRARYGRLAVSGATDVRNQLLGVHGAARVFGPQKGATPAQVRRLEAGLRRFARIVRRDLHRSIARLPGGGAAGGLGAGLAAFFRAPLGSGAELVFDALGLDAALRRADLVLTGEGNLDAQTAYGKLVARVCARARRRRVPVLASAGRVWLSPAGVRRLGLAGAWPIAPPGTTRAESLRRAAPLLAARVAAVLRNQSIVGP